MKTSKEEARALMISPTTASFRRLFHMIGNELTSDASSPQSSVHLDRDVVCALHLSLNEFFINKLVEKVIIARENWFLVFSMFCFTGSIIILTNYFLALFLFPRCTFSGRHGASPVSRGLQSP